MQPGATCLQVTRRHLVRRIGRRCINVAIRGDAMDAPDVGRHALYLKRALDLRGKWAKQGRDNKKFMDWTHCQAARGGGLGITSSSSSMSAKFFELSS
jgi:hypothetical protein